MSCCSILRFVCFISLPQPKLGVTEADMHSLSSVGVIKKVVSSSRPSIFSEH